jgi:ethanolamine utilization protein EutN
MKICKVVGNVTTSLQEPIYNGVRIMIVQPLGPDLKPQGETFLSCDFVQSGPGDITLVETEGNAARQLFMNEKAPVHSVIVAIVDEVRMDSKK